MKFALISLFRLSAEAADDQVIAAATAAQERSEALNGTAFGHLNGSALRFALTKASQGWDIGRAVNTAELLDGLTEAEQADALNRAKAGLKLEDAIAVVRAQAAENERASAQ